MAAVRAILDVLGTLPATLKERHDLASRVAAMERDQEQFRGDISGLLAECGLSQSAADTLASANTLVERHEAARRAAQPEITNEISRHSRPARRPRATAGRG
jgi:uncharacterized protein YhaN